MSYFLLESLGHLEFENRAGDLLLEEVAILFPATPAITVQITPDVVGGPNIIVPAVVDFFSGPCIISNLAVDVFGGSNTVIRSFDNSFDSPGITVQYSAADTFGGPVVVKGKS